MKPTAILCADLHIRATQPICRTDDYLATQKAKIDFLVGLSITYDCPIIVAGDFGHKAMWPNWLLTQLIEQLTPLPHRIIVCPGQHDLPQHRVDKWREGGLGVLDEAGMIEVVTQDNYHDFSDNLVSCCAYGEEPKRIKKFKSKSYQYKTVLVIHKMLIDKPLWPGQQATRALAFLKKWKCYDLIVVGDNHQPFVVEHEGRLLVNCGSMMRMNVDQINHKPKCYLWYAKTNTVEDVYFPIEQDVIDRQHIDEARGRDERIAAFTAKLKGSQEIHLSFEDNLKVFFDTNTVHKRVQQKVWEAIEE